MDGSVGFFLSQRCLLDLCEFMLGFQRQAERIMGQDSMGNDLCVMIPGHHLWATCTDKPRVAGALGCHAGALGRGAFLLGSLCWAQQGLDRRKVQQEGKGRLS